MIAVDKILGSMKAITFNLDPCPWLLWGHSKEGNIGTGEFLFTLIFLSRMFPVYSSRRQGARPHIAAAVHHLDGHFLSWSALRVGHEDALEHSFLGRPRSSHWRIGPSMAIWPQLQGSYWKLVHHCGTYLLGFYREEFYHPCFSVYNALRTNYSQFGGWLSSICGHYSALYTISKLAEVFLNGCLVMIVN